MPDELKYTKDVWRELAIPQIEKNATKNCLNAGGLEYDKCNIYNINFVEMDKKYSGNLDKLKGSPF